MPNSSAGGDGGAVDGASGAALLLTQSDFYVYLLLAALSYYMWRKLQRAAGAPPPLPAGAFQPSAADKAAAAGDEFVGDEDDGVEEDNHLHGGLAGGQAADGGELDTLADLRAKAGRGELEEEDILRELGEEKLSKHGAEMLADLRATSPAANGSSDDEKVGGGCCGGGGGGEAGAEGCGCGEDVAAGGGSCGCGDSAGTAAEAGAGEPLEVTVVYASLTGTAEGFARSIGRAIDEQCGGDKVAVSVIDMAQVKEHIRIPSANSCC